MNRTPVDYAIDAAKELVTAVDNLAQCLVQGVERPWRPASEARQRERDEVARLERLERIDIAPGEGPAPLDLDVMDELVKILEAAEEMAQSVCVALDACLIPSRSSLDDPRRFLRFLIAHLPTAEQATPGISSKLQDRSRDLTEEAADVLGLMVDGQVLKAVCPWCKGRTETRPLGGAHTLRIRIVRGHDMPLVVCEGGLCEPPEADCGVWVKGRPAWLQSEWEWLADRIDRASQVAS